MSMFLLTEYLFSKSITQKPPDISVKQEFIDVEVLNNQCKVESFNGDMICRVCTNAADIPVTSRFDEILIMNAIRTVANISINETDYYPKYVCESCLDELKIAFYFKRKCEKSDVMFRKALLSDTMISTSSQPMVKHDFELILNQKKLHKEASKNSPVKYNGDRDDNYSPVNLEASKAVDKIENKEQKVTKIRRTKVAQKKTVQSSKTRSRLILKKVKPPNKSPKTDWTISDTQPLKKVKSNVKKIRELICRRCDVKFDTQVALTKHKKNCSIHHPCPLCGKLVLDLTQHKNVMHYKRHEYTCHQCGKVYYSGGALANHMYVHNDTLEYSCDLCPYKGKRKYSLVCHMRVHTGEHRYLCSKCPAKFTNPSNLKKHALMHSGKQFECAKCKKMFRQKKMMQEHYDSIHMHIRYRCSICRKDLSTRRKLLTHELRMHKREKHKLFQDQQKVVITSENE